MHNVIASCGFIENIKDQCIYLKASGRKYIFFVLYVYDILLASGDLCLLYEIKQFISQKFNMNNLGEASHVIGIEIHREKSQMILELSQKVHIKKVLKRFRMSNFASSVALIFK